VLQVARADDEPRNADERERERERERGRGRETLFGKIADTSIHTYIHTRTRESINRIVRVESSRKRV